MPDTKLKPELKELFDLARTRKVLTYDEIHKHLPANIMDESQIDALLLKIVTEFNCELVDFAKKIPVTDGKSRELEIDKHDDEDEEDEIKAEADTLVRGNDPVKMYLHEMGGVSLLTREGEVEIAKRIEHGEQQVFTVIIGCPVTIKEVLALGDKLRKGNEDVIFSGGVMSSDVIREYIESKRTSVYFCSPPYLSADNAVGTAILAARAKEQE